MLKISIIEGHHRPITRETKFGIRYSQIAYAHFGGAFPSEVEVPLESLADAKSVGDYQLSLNCFQVGKYKKLEINPFKVELIPFAKTFAKAG